MKIGIMQPYFFPYIGYFQLMNLVDEYIIYDNIKFTKKGWINRNRILIDGKDGQITLPLRKDSDFLDVKDRYLADAWSTERKKMLNRITESYKKAPFYNDAFPVISKALSSDESNLFSFLYQSINLVKEYLDIPTKMVVSSTVTIDHSLRSAHKVIAICKGRNADEYINPSGGMDLYDKDHFDQQGIKLQFIRTNSLTYPQYPNKEFVPALSIIDVMMFNSREQIKTFLQEYTLQ